MNRYFPSRVLCLTICAAFCGFSASGEEEPHRGVKIANEAGATVLAETTDHGLKILILSDSMGFGGFAEELDDCFRSCPGVSSGTHDRGLRDESPEHG